ncbi:hypothetical protein PM082_020013 [Marasmius tenuissimus]|nr:hypothetical protein PM082_020013 [Marasmius tenuissimus]
MLSYPLLTSLTENLLRSLYGAGSVLVMQYYCSYNSSDSIPVRCAVGMVFSFASAHVVFLSHQMYIDFVTWFAQPKLLDTILPSASGMLIGTFLTAFTAQIFYSTRIYNRPFGVPSDRIRYWYVVCSTSSLDFCHLIPLGPAQTISISSFKSYSLLETTKMITSTKAGFTVACDVTITLILCYLLNSSRSGSRRTDSAIDKLIIYAVDRGTATSLTALVQLILFVAKPGTLIFTIFLTPSCHLYVISVCSMLISRERLRKQLRAMPNRDFQFSEFSEIGNSGVEYHLPNTAAAAVISGHHRGLQVFKEVSVRRFDDS